MTLKPTLVIDLSVQKRMCIAPRELSAGGTVEPQNLPSCLADALRPPKTWTKSNGQVLLPAVDQKQNMFVMLINSIYMGHLVDDTILHMKLCLWWAGEVVVGWLLNVPATCECISGSDLLRQFYVLPHWDGSCRSNFPSHPVTVYWHRADQSQRWPYNSRCLAG